MKKVLLIAGQKRSGKDTLARFVKEELEHLGKSARVISFAQPMKEIIAVTLGISMEELDDLKNNSDNPHRGYLQRFGTEAMKPWFGKNVWADLAIKKIQEAEEEIIIISDFRFPEEGEKFPTLFDTTTVKVIRKGLPTDLSDLHISERALEDFKFSGEIYNDGDLIDLKASALVVTSWLL